MMAQIDGPEYEQEIDLEQGDPINTDNTHILAYNGAIHGEAMFENYGVHVRQRASDLRNQEQTRNVSVGLQPKGEIKSKYEIETEIQFAIGRDSECMIWVD